MLVPSNYEMKEPDFMKKTMLQHSGAFLLTVFLAVLLLLLGACLPQAPIDSHVRASAEVMAREGDYPVMADRSYASILDYVTDALILMESKSTSIADPETIFTNPQYQYPQEDDSTVLDLYQYSVDSNPESTKYYVQYWMGFRPLMRLMLCFFDYYQILRYIAVAFFVLLAAVMCSIANRAGTKTAFLFALSMILVRPHVVAVSLQFSCCFLIAFLAMLAVPWIHRHAKWESLFFLELGILTQYFDFYTTPILTFALPMTYLYILKSQDQQAVSLKNLGCNGLSWCAGYGLMWLAKLVLTSLFTPVNALAQGFASFCGRIGIEKVSGMESYYSPIAALRAVFVSLYSDSTGKLVLFAAAAVTFLVLLVRFLRDKHQPKELLNHWQLLIIAALPVIWFIAAAQPTANHHWFQYRSIAASFWAGFQYLQYLLQRKPDLTASMK